MNSVLRVFVSLCMIVLSFSSCVEVEEYDNTPSGNFEALWKIMDERYCFFSYKEIDWDKIYDEYKGRINDGMSKEALFTVLNEMLQELKDGHVNLYTTWDIGRYWNWFQDYPDNFDQKLIDKYLGTDYSIAAGMKYKVLDDNIGYIYYEDFSSTIGPSSLDYILNKFAICEGIIIDVRHNGGGTLTNATELSSRFTNEKVLAGYIQHKTGKGHDDFSELFPRYIEPSSRIRYQKPVVVLVNRRAYSATNEFICTMKLFPTVTVMGDKSGGGGGLPFSSELPNGWSVRFSACPNFDAEKKQIEFGIEPDEYIEWVDSDTKDSFIETARNYLKAQNKNQ